MHTIVTATLLLGLLGAEPADDPALAQAKAHVEQARKLFLRARYAQALEHFEAARKLKPRASLWFNIGKCHDRLNAFSSALRAYRIYLHEAPDAPDRREVTAAIKRMEKKLRATGVQQLLVFTDPDGATVSVEGKGSQPAPAAFELKPGQYTVSVSQAGLASASLAVTMTAKESVEIQVPLRPEAPVASAAEEPPPPPAVAAAPPPAPDPAPAVPAPSGPEQAATPPPPADPAQPGADGTVAMAALPPAVLTPTAPPAQPASSPAPALQPAPAAVQRGGHLWTYVAAGTSLAAAGVGAGLGYMSSTARAELLGSRHPEAEANEIYRRAQTNATYANISYGAAAAAGVAAIVLFFAEMPTRTAAVEPGAAAPSSLAAFHF